MKTLCRHAILVAVLGLGQQLFGLPIQEQFAYPPATSLIGQSPGGPTWVTAGSGAEQPTIESGNLPVPGLADATGNRVRMVAGAGTSARLPFGGAESNGVVFCSFAMKVANVGGLGTGTDFIAAFTTSDAAQATTPANGFWRIFLRAASGGYQIGLSKSTSVAGDIAWHATTFTSNDIVLVVGSYTFTAGPGNDTARLWINPSAANFGSSNAPAPVLTVTAGPDASQLASIVLFQKAAPVLPALLQVDELRLGASWASVTPRAVANLAVSVGNVPAQLEEGSLLTVPVTTSNLGPHTATSVQLTFAVPAGAVLQSVSNDHGSCTVQGSNVTCSVSTLAAQQSFNVQAVFSVDPQFAGQNGEEFWSWDWWYIASAAEFDPNPANNQALVAVLAIPNRDFGDARLVAAGVGYPVTLAENGARHRNGAVWHMGAFFDREPNGVHSALADADDLAGAPDDEDGVTIPTPMLAGRTYNVMVNVPVAGFLDAFFDFNNNGSWINPGERVTPAGGLPIGPGVIAVPVAVPLAAVSGSPHARFRFSDVGGLAPTGFHPVGEVEDYQVEIRRVDFGSAPDPAYRTLLANDGARHVVDPAWFLGATLDWEADGLDGADGDGVVFTTPLTPGTVATVQVTASIAGMLDAFIDFYSNNDWVDAGERITLAAGRPVVAGVNVINFNVPADAKAGASWARFRFSNTGGLASTGPASIGEVEDYPVTIPSPAVDFPFLGIAHRALGNAVLTVASNELRVSNLGAGGQDGVAIQLGESEGWRGTIAAPLDAEGSKLSWNVQGTVNGTSNQPVSLGRMEVINGEITAFGDFSALGASTYLVRAYSNGVLLASVVVPSGSAAYKFPAPGRPGPITFHWQALDPDDNDTDPRCIGDWLQACPIVLNNGPTVNANEVSVTPMAATARVSAVSKINFFGQWASGELTLRAASVQKFGLFHTALGQARLGLTGDMSEETGKLTVSNLGTSGQDGVSVELGALNALSVLYGPVLRLEMPCIDEIITLSGKVGNQEGVLGTAGLHVNDTDGTIQLRGNFSSIGVSSFLLEVWNGSQPARSVTVPGGTLGTIAAQGGVAIDLSGCIEFLTGQGQPAVEFAFASPVSVTPNGGGAVVGDRVRCTASGATVVERLTRVDLTWAGFTTVSFRILFRDYGDAPTGYPVTQAENGASHSYSANWTLGTYRDREFNGNHSANSDYDDTHGLFTYPASTDDEDGVVVTAATGGIQVQVTAAVNGYLDGWIDLNRNLSWGDAGEKVADAVPLVAGVPKYINIPAPVCTPAGQFFSRWRLSETGGLSYTGYGGKGEVEDHVINWQPETTVALDFGDAPEAGTGFEVKLGRNGARHLASVLRLGLNWDAEADGQPSAGAALDDTTGAPDDEDGVVLPAGGFVPGAVANVDVTVMGGPGVLDAWFDWNNNLVWDAPERSIAGVPVAPGVNHVPVNVPAGIAGGQRYARFRLSTMGTPTTTGCAADGEVEDYFVTVTGVGSNLVDLVVISIPPTLTVEEGTPLSLTLLVSNKGPATATSVTGEIHFPPGATLDGLQLSQGTGQMEGTNLVCHLNNLAPGQSATVQFTAGTAGIFDGRGEEFMDWCFDFFSAEVELTPTDNTDHPAIGVAAKRDFGDAPDGYHTLFTSDGARHRPNALFLGASVDAEPNGLPSPLAAGDDSAGADDEDGVVLPAFFPIGGAANVTVTASLAGVLDVWADFNGDGDWLDAGEHVIIGAGIPAGPSLIVIPVPAWTVAGNCFLRFRLSPAGTPNPTGYINGGEVEDYVVATRAPGPPSPAGNVRVQTDGGRLRVSWDNPDALLQTAASLDGQWTTLTEAAESFEATPDTEQRFFRVVHGRTASRSGLGRRTFASMVREAELIVDAVVTDVKYMNSDGDGTNSASWPHTFVTMQILDTLKGRLATSNLCLRFLGGLDADGDRILQVSHSTRFDVGERSILFVRRNGSAARPLVGAAEGRLRVVNGLVYSEHGHRLVLTESQRLAFGAREELDEVHQDLIGSNVVGHAHSTPQGEAPPPAPPAGQHMGVAAFKAALAQIIQLQHTAAELQNPVLTLSADCTRPFHIPIPRHRPAPSIPAARVPAEPDDEEAARVKANGGNPVLPPNR